MFRCIFLGQCTLKLITLTLQRLWHALSVPSVYVRWCNAAAKLQATRYRCWIIWLPGSRAVCILGWGLVLRGCGFLCVPCASVTTNAHCCLLLQVVRELQVYDNTADDLVGKEWNR